MPAENPHIPPDDLERSLTVARPEQDQSLPHLGVAGDTYTILLSGKETAGKFCLIDMLVHPEGGPPPHRHDYEETFIMLDGEIELTFRGEESALRAGETANIPANAPHFFRNVSGKTARMLCVCVPPGEDELFQEVGVPLPTRTTPPPKLDEAAQAAAKAKAASLAEKYRTEFL